MQSVGEIHSNRANKEVQSFFNATQSSVGVSLEGGGVAPAPNIVGRLTLEKDWGPLHFGAF